MDREDFLKYLKEEGSKVQDFPVTYFECIRDTHDWLYLPGFILNDFPNQIIPKGAIVWVDNGRLERGSFLPFNNKFEINYRKEDFVEIELKRTFLEWIRYYKYVQV